jgi:hypothetical protein
MILDLIQIIHMIAHFYTCHRTCQKVKKFPSPSRKIEKKPFNIEKYASNSPKTAHNFLKKILYNRSQATLVKMPL